MSGCTRIKTLADVIGGQSPESADVAPLRTGVPFIQGNAEFGARYPAPIWECSTASRYALPGDALVSVRAPVGAVNIANTKLGIGRGVAAVRARNPSFGRWLYWVLVNAEQRLQAEATGSTFTAITGQDIADLGVVVPPDPKLVADYLDRETAEIDGFIADQHQLIELLSERNLAGLIHSVVGTSKAHNQYGCAVPWSPGLTTPFRVLNLRRVAQMKTGHTPSRQHSEYWVDTSIPWFTLADVWQLRAGRKYLGETTERISSLGLANSAAELLPAGTVVLSRTASVGFTGIMPVPMATSQDYWNWVCGPELVPEYLWYQFRAMRPEFNRLMSGSTHKTIYQADAAGLQVVVPPLAVQQEINDELTVVDQEMTDAQNDAQLVIELAKERRSALISAAVTGQIDVTAKHKPIAEQVEDELEGAR